MMARWFNKQKTQKHMEVIDFMYQILFSRNAEQAAIDHWSTFLDEGLSYKALFEQLWCSQEFADKAEQNLYLKKSSPMNTIAKHEPDASLSSELINDEMFQKIVEKLSQERNLLLQIDHIRSLVAKWRYRDLRGADNVKFYKTPEGNGIIENTIAHNEAAIRSYVGLQRGNMVINPLGSISWVKANLSSLKVLSIGARTEMELFSLLAMGFDLKNITMVDLISYSPYVELGDMHNLNYADNSFDIVVVSTVFLCSNNKTKAASEILRVIKPGGIVAFGDKCPLVDCSDLTPVEAQLKSEYLSSTEDVLKLFQPHVGTIYFKSDPIPPYNDEITTSIVAIFGAT
jgi:hypothetical protein